MDELERQILIYLMFNEEYTRKSLVFIKEHYFQNITFRTSFKCFAQCFNPNTPLPDVGMILVALEEIKGISSETIKDVKEFLNNLKCPHSINTGQMLVKTEEWCKKREIYNVILENVDKLEENPNDLGNLPDALSKALAITFNTSIGISYDSDIEERYNKLYNNKEERISFGIKKLDEITGGGLSPKTLNVIAAGTGAGKTMFLCNLAKNLYLAGKNVLYITLEMAEERISERIDCNLLNVDLFHLPELTLEQYRDKFNNAIKGKKYGKLIIKEYPTCGANTSNFRALLNDLKLKKGFEADVLIVDYINICGSTRSIKSDNTYHFIKSVCEELRALAIQENFPIVTCTQFNRGGNSSTNAGILDISESHGLAMTADLLLGMIRTEDLDENNEVMFKQLKNRFGDIAHNNKFTLSIERSKMRITDKVNSDEYVKEKIGGSKLLLEASNTPSRQPFHNPTKIVKVKNASSVGRLDKLKKLFDKTV